MNLKSLLFFCFMFSNCCIAQFSDYGYKREIKDINNQWHTINLTPDILSKVDSDLHDVRIYGITPKNDTIEAPYIAQIEKGNVLDKPVRLKITNPSNIQDTYFFTLQLDASSPVNTIDLDFNQTNFDWYVTLEGSQNLTDWYTIVTNYRLVSIENQVESYKFTKLNFPYSTYKNYRISFKSPENVALLGARIYSREVVAPKFNNHAVTEMVTKLNKKNKQSILEVVLENYVPINQIQFFIANAFDYYRPFKIQYVADSIQTNAGTQYVYKTITNGVLSSLEENTFKEENFYADKFRVVIDNYDNKPLHFDSIQVKGYQHKLLARFNDAASYYLVYDNPYAAAPNYDIQKFIENIPAAADVTLGEAQIIPQKNTKIEPELVEPIFKNKLWLWAIMFVIAILLGWASFTMLKKQ